MTRLAIVAGGLVLLAACGQKGSLYLPSPAPASAASAPLAGR